MKRHGVAAFDVARDSRDSSFDMPHRLLPAIFTAAIAPAYSHAVKFLLKWPATFILLIACYIAQLLHFSMQIFWRHYMRGSPIKIVSSITIEHHGPLFSVCISGAYAFLLFALCAI